MSECHLPWEAMLIDVNGDVRVCCNNQTIMGNLKENTIREIWNNEKYQELRKRIKEKDFSYGCEKNCTFVLNSDNGEAGYIEK